MLKLLAYYRGHTLKLDEPGCTRDSRKYFFSHRVVGRWNSLHQEMVDALESLLQAETEQSNTNTGGLFHGLIH